MNLFGKKRPNIDLDQSIDASSKKDDLNIKKKDKTVIKKKEKKEEEEESKEKEDENEEKKDEKEEEKKDEQLSIKKKEKTSIKRKTKKNEEEDKKEEESKEEETKDEESSQKEENNKENEIVLAGKGKTKIIKKNKKKEEDEIEVNIEIPEIQFNYNELRKKCIENYNVVDENHFYRSKPKLRGIPNMKEIREMFNINVPNEDNKININDYGDSERGTFYKNFVENVGQAQSEKIIGKSYLSKVIDDSQKQSIIQSVNQNFFSVGTKSTVQVLRSVDEIGRAHV